MKKIVLFQMLVIVALLSLFVTSCEKEPKDSDSVTIESTELPKSSGEDIFAGKTFTGRNSVPFNIKYEFDNEGSVIYSETSSYFDTVNYVKIAKYKYSYIVANPEKEYYYNKIHFKPIGYYVDDVLYTNSDEYANKLIDNIKNDSISVSDEYTEILKKIYKYQFNSTKFVRSYNYSPEYKEYNLTFTSDITIRNISNILCTPGTDISDQIARRSFKTELGVTSTNCSFAFTDKSSNNLLKQIDFQIYECTKNKAKVVCTYLEQTAGGKDSLESQAEYKVAGYGNVTVDYKIEWVPIPSTNTKEQKIYTKVKITGVDDSLKEYLTQELADISGTGEGLDISSILDKEFIISLPATSDRLATQLGMLE